jgi:xanthine dehydrogenase iron-sulfur cluster and FAD-binding subunit A
VLNFLREDLRCTGTKEGAPKATAAPALFVVGELAGNEVALKHR